MFEALTFDDVLLVPHYSEILPDEVDLSTSLSEKVHLKIPVLSAAMDTVTEGAMALALAQLGGMGIIHKNMTAQDQASIVASVKQTSSDLQVGAAIGVGDDGLSRAEALYNAGADALVIDTAHAHSKKVLCITKEIKRRYPETTLIVGNIASPEAALDLAEIGVRAIKVGIGPGSICTTRIVTGVGVPQLTAIMRVYNVLKGSGVRIIADGGIRYSGDIVKALAAGADCVMLGSMFAGCEESPGDVIDMQGCRYKAYRGMGSIGAMKQGSADRYFQKNNASKFVAEGVEGMVPYKGLLKDLLYQILGGVRSGMGYLGAKDLDTLKKRARFCQITQAGRNESHVHSLQKIEATPNYSCS